MDPIQTSLFWIAVVAAGAAAAMLSLWNLKIRPGTGRFLCDDCQFNSPDKCLKAERPRATECMSYRTEDWLK